MRRSHDKPLWRSKAERHDSFAAAWTVTEIKRRPNTGLLDVTLDGLDYPSQMAVVCDLLGNDPVEVACWHGAENRQKWWELPDRQKHKQSRDFTEALQWFIKKALLPARDREIAELVAQLRLLTKEEPERRAQIARELTEK